MNNVALPTYFIRNYYLDIKIGQKKFYATRLILEKLPK